MIQYYQAIDSDAQDYLKNWKGHVMESREERVNQTEPVKREERGMHRRKEEWGGGLKLRSALQTVPGWTAVPAIPTSTAAGEEYWDLYSNNIWRATLCPGLYYNSWKFCHC